MNDLTEQWKKGELPSGWYYINSGDIDYKYSKYSSADFFVTPHEDIKEVLASVPSYEEWQSMDRLEKIMLQERARLNKQVIELLEENTKLKELLKQARESVYVERASDNSLGYTIWNYTTKLINEINQALGEDK